MKKSSKPPLPNTCSKGNSAFQPDCGVFIFFAWMPLREALGLEKVSRWELMLEREVVLLVERWLQAELEFQSVQG